MSGIDRASLFLDRRRRETLAGLAVLATATAAFVSLQLSNPGLLPSGPVLNGVDLNDYFFPAASYLHSALQDGELPLWNPFQYAGAPFLAAHATQAAYPPVALLAFAQPHVLLVVNVIGHFFLLACFTFAFARSAGLTLAGSIAMALVYLFSYSTIGSIHNPAYLCTFAWGPAVLWGVQAVLKKPGALTAAGFAAAVAMLLLSGYSQASLYSLQIAALFALTALLTSGGEAIRTRTFGWLALGALLGVTAAAVQLLPAFELARLGVRSIHGMSIDLADPLDWRFVYAVDFWNLFTGQTSRIVHPPPGLALAVLAACLPRARRRLGLFFFVMMLAALDFARGRDGWIFPVYFQLPLGDIFRLPGRTIFLVDFAAAALVGIAISNLESFSNRRRLVQISSLALAFLVGAAACWRNPLYFRFDPLVDPSPLYERGPLADFSTAVAAKQSRMFIQRSIIGQASRNYGMVRSVYVVPGYDPILPASYSSFFKIPKNVTWHGDLSVIGLGRFSRPWPPQDPRFLDLLSVSYYVDALPSDPSRPSANPFLKQRVGAPPLPFDALPVHPRKAAVPRAYLVHDAIVAETDEEALRLVHGLEFDPHRQVVLTGTRELDPGRTDPDAAEHATITRYRRNSVEIDAECASACILVLTDLWYPGWQVFVDDREHEIMKANYLLRAVRLEAGTHRVRFVYFPWSFWGGLLVSAASLLVVAALAGAGIVAGRRTRAGQRRDAPARA